jgi:hypothetical protein
MAGLPPRSAPLTVTKGGLAYTLRRSAPLLVTLAALSACASPERKAYNAALSAARTDPGLCQPERYGASGIYQPLISQAWQKAHSTAGADAQNNAIPDSAAPVITVSGLSPTPEVNIPPYSQRACHMTVTTPGHAPETGFLTVVYYTHNGRVDTSLARWNSDSFISQYYDELKAKLRSGVDTNNPVLKACMEHYPAIDPKSMAPAMQQAAVSLRAMLVRRCLANHAALQNLYQDMYFIHR